MQLGKGCSDGRGNSTYASQLGDVCVPGTASRRRSTRTAPWASPSVSLHAQLGPLHSVGAHESSSVWSDRPGPEVQSCPWLEDSRGGCPQAGLNPTYLAAEAGRTAPSAIGPSSRGRGLGLAGAETLTSRRRLVATRPEDHRCSALRRFSNNTSAEAALPGDVQDDGQ